MLCCCCFDCFSDPIDNSNQSKDLEMEIVLHKQTSRYLANPFIDDALNAAKLVTREWLISNIQSVAEQLANIKMAEGEYRDGINFSTVLINWTVLKIETVLINWTIF